MYRTVIAVAALAVACAASALAQAPDPNYVSPCPKPALEKFPALPNPATATEPQVQSATKAYKAWNAPVDAYAACKKKEFASIKAEANTPAAKEVADYADLLDKFNKAVDARKAAGVTVAVKRSGPATACTAPAWVEPPPIPTPADGKKLSKDEQKQAGSAAGAWAQPYADYFQCAGPGMKAKQVEASGIIKPLQAKLAAAQAEYDAVGAQVQPYIEKWNAFAVAVNARAHGH